MSSNWDQIKTASILEALRVALINNDDRLSHASVVDIIRGTLEGTMLTAEKLADLKVIADNSKSIQTRSKLMLNYFCQAALTDLGLGGPFLVHGTRMSYAADITCDFLKRSGSGAFPLFDRDEVGIDLLLRIADPDIINQDQAGLCGPVSFLFTVAKDSPAVYAKYAIDLYEKGAAKIFKIEVKPSDGARTYAPPSTMSSLDWMTAAGLRDSENWFLADDNVKVRFADGTSASEIATWFDDAGYSDVQYEDGITLNLDSGDIAKINKLFQDGYSIVLRVNSQMLKPDKQDDGSWRGNHFIVLRSIIATSPQSVALYVYTWGHGYLRIPRGGPLPEKAFLGNLYGYIAAKPY